MIKSFGGISIDMSKVTSVSYKDVISRGLSERGLILSYTCTVSVGCDAEVMPSGFLAKEFHDAYSEYQSTGKARLSEITKTVRALTQ